MMKKVLTCLMLISTISWASGQNSVKKWTLEECVNYAWENNLSVRGSQLTQLQNEINLKQSRFALLPNLSAGGSVGKSFGRTIDPVTNSFVSQAFTSGGISANTNLTVYQGGILRNRIEQGEVNLEASKYDLEKAKNDIGLTVATNFLNVLLNREQLENAKFQLQISTEQLERTKILVEAGSLPLTNQLDLESQKASNEVQVVNTENAVNIALLNLKQAMQMPASEALDIEAPNLEVEQVQMAMENPTSIYEVAVANQPEIKSAELGVKSSDLGVQISKGAFLPSLSVGGSLSTNYSDQARQFLGLVQQAVPAQEIGFVQGTNQAVFTNPSTRAVSQFAESYSVVDQFDDNLGQSVRVNLSVPIFNRLANTSNLQRAKITKQQAELTQQNVQNQLRQNIETAYNNAIAGLKSYEATEKRVKALEESFRVTDQRYNVGDANFVDYQVASNNLFAARTDLVRAKYEYIFRVTILEFYLGNPITLD